MLSVKNISASYDKNLVVNDVSFDCAAGEVFGFAGLNGVGKTTLIKTILGLKEPSSGRVVLSGGRESVAYLPEKFSPPLSLTGEEFIRFSLKFYKRAVSFEEMCTACDTLFLDHGALKKRISTYSKGMRQKIGLLATFLTRARLLILDEPMSGLDPRARQGVKNIIAAAKGDDRTVFFTSHVLNDFLELCDSFAVFHNGGVLFHGEPKAFLNEMKEKDLEKAFLKKIEFCEV